MHLIGRCILCKLGPPGAYGGARRAERALLPRAGAHVLQDAGPRVSWLLGGADDMMLSDARPCTAHSQRNAILAFFAIIATAVTISDDAAGARPSHCPGPAYGRPTVGPN